MPAKRSKILVPQSVFIVENIEKGFAGKVCSGPCRIMGGKPYKASLKSSAYNSHRLNGFYTFEVAVKTHFVFRRNRAAPIY